MESVWLQCSLPPRLAVYWQVYRFGFLVFDDPAYVSENRHVLAGLTTSGIRWAFTTVHDSNWIPLTWLSLMADASVYGTWAGGYHLTNLLLHAANVLLVFAAFRHMTGNMGRSALRCRRCLPSIRCTSSRSPGSPSARTC